MSTTKKLLSVSFRQELAVHATCWGLFIVYEISILYYISKALEPLYIFLIYYSINICYFYLHGHLVAKAWSYRGTRRLGYAVLIALLFLFTVCLKQLADHLTRDAHFSMLSYASGKYWPYNIFRTCYFAVLSTFCIAAMRLGAYRRRTFQAERAELIAQRENAQAQNQLHIAEIAYLRQQINPHLLFNTLNFIYNEVYKHDEEASRAVLLLAGIMRYSLQEPDAAGKVWLSEEMDQLKNLIEMNRMRFRQQPSISVQLTGKAGEWKIIPLILLTLTENIFKHGDLTDPLAPAILHIRIREDGHFYYRSRNRVKRRKVPDAGSNTGMENVRRRLELAYAERFQLESTLSEEIYECHLIVSL